MGLDTFLGLPLHPLVVHAVVVLLPLSALALVLAAVVTRWRPRLLEAATAVLTVAVAAAVVARFSGEALAAEVGTPVTHMEWADRTVWASVALWLAALVWVVVVRRGAGRAASVAAAATAVLGVAVTGLVLLTGHTGAESTWGGDDGRIARSQAQAESGDEDYTLAQVEEHASAESCWAVVDGGVYDLTDWIAEHPGGPDRIEALCGTDATERFTGQHGDNQAAQQVLSEHRIGQIATE